MASCQRQGMPLRSLVLQVSGEEVSTNASGSGKVRFTWDSLRPLHGSIRLIVLTYLMDFCQPSSIRRSRISGGENPGPGVGGRRMTMQSLLGLRKETLAPCRREFPCQVPRRCGKKRSERRQRRLGFLLLARSECLYGLVADAMSLCLCGYNPSSPFEPRSDL